MGSTRLGPEAEKRGLSKSRKYINVIFLPVKAPATDDEKADDEEEAAAEKGSDGESSSDDDDDDDVQIHIGEIKTTPAAAAG